MTFSPFLKNKKGIRYVLTPVPLSAPTEITASGKALLSQFKQTHITIVYAYLIKLRTISITWYRIHTNCVITRCADTGLVPPASGVIVNVVALPAGFRTVRIELITVVCTKAIPTI